MKWILGTVLTGMWLVSCTGERDMPEAPDTDLTANISIAELVDMYGSMSYNPIDTALYIEGVVVANDVSGNIYKKIYVQDSTGGIDVEIEMTNNAHKYPLGQRLVIDLNGMAFGLYGGQPQLGGQGGGSVARLYEPECDEHFYRKGYASDVNLPDPFTFPTIRSLTRDDEAYIGRLIRLDSVYFVDTAQTYVIPGSSPAGNAQNRQIKDIGGNTLDVRVSMYAMFAYDSIPSGKVSVQGILGIYNGSLQLFPRDGSDIKKYESL